jgi:hypothetical protein
MGGKYCCKQKHVCSLSLSFVFSSEKMRPVSRKLFPLAELAVVFLMTGCAQAPGTATSYTPAPLATKEEGATGSLLGEKMNTWEVIESNDGGRVVGLSMPLNLIEKAQNEAEGPISLQMPSDAQASAFVNHVDVQYAPTGIASDFQKPSFLVRFYNIGQPDQASINCTDSIKIDAGRIPDGYTNPSEKEGSCEKRVGSRSSEISIKTDLDHPTPFGRVNFGYDKGKMIFIEIAITGEELQKRKDFTLFIPSPASLGSDAQIPANFTAVYQSKTDSYDLSVWSFSNPDSALNGSNG